MKPHNLQLKLSIVKCLERAEPFLHYSDVCDTVYWSLVVFTGVYSLMALSTRGPPAFLDC